MHECHAVVEQWMKAIGMQVSVDAAGNIRGLQGSGKRPRLLMGSHLDTVPCAGAYDGVLGVCLALAVVEALREASLPFDVEVIGFSEEEGVRFRTPFLGSLALVGRLDANYLALLDANSISVQEAIQQFGLDPLDVPKAQLDDRAFAFIEFHIEQGPVLDLANESVAVVSAIAGQTRMDCSFEGRANHAGTTPMNARQDALGGAAEWALGVEEFARSSAGLLATIGKMDALPGAANIIPGQVRASLDVRHAEDAIRIAACQKLCSEGRSIASRRRLQFSAIECLEQRSVAMDERLVSMMEVAMSRYGETPRRMISGAGHDAMIMAGRVPSVMLFIRSIDGVSHHPDESVAEEDVEKAIGVGAQMLKDLASDERRWT